MPKSRSSRRNRKDRKPGARPVGQQAARIVAQPIAVASAGEAPTISAPKERTATSRVTRRDYSYVRRDLQRIAVLASAVLIIIVALSFFIP